MTPVRNVNGGSQAFPTPPDTDGPQRELSRGGSLFEDVAEPGLDYMASSPTPAGRSHDNVRPGGLFAEDPFQAIRRNLDMIEAGFPAREVSRFS